MALVADVTIIFDLNGERYEIPFERVRFSTWADLEDKAGFTPVSLLKALKDGSPKAIGATIWLGKRQRLPNLTWESVVRELDDLLERVEFAPVDIVLPNEKQSQQDKGSDKGPDPTVAGGDS